MNNMYRIYHLFYEKKQDPLIDAEHLLQGISKNIEEGLCSLRIFFCY